MANLGEKSCSKNQGCLPRKRDHEERKSQRLRVCKHFLFMERDGEIRGTLWLSCTKSLEILQGCLKDSSLGVFNVFHTLL
jgi:hypothetical protein